MTQLSSKFGNADSNILSRIHDISSINCHVKDLATFGESLEQAARAVSPNNSGQNQRSRYRETHVLLFSWEEDNLGVYEKVDVLREVFQHVYHYDTEYFKIPSYKCHTALAMRLARYAFRNQFL